MPDRLLADGSRVFDHLRAGTAIELVTTGGYQILIRPDGYIAYIGPEHFDEYAGESVAHAQVPFTPIQRKGENSPA